MYGLAGTTMNPKNFGFPQVALSNQFTTIGDATGFTSRIDRDFELTMSRFSGDATA